MRVAALDCGTNSVRLLVAELSGDGHLVDLERQLRIVRLGQDVDRTRRLAPQALSRTREALLDYAATIREHRAERVRMVATSATRDAENRADFVGMVHDILGVDPEVVTGLEEASLSYHGAVGTLDGLADPVLLTDIGGGSSELVLGGEPLRAHSMDVGSVRMTERHFRNDPPTSDQVSAVVADVNGALDAASSDVPLGTSASLVGVAGTVTTVAAVAQGLTEYDPNRIHGYRLAASEVARVTDLLLSLDHSGRSAIRAIHPGRVDVIAAGAVILRTIVQRADASEVVVSEHDILDGIALSLLD